MATCFFGATDFRPSPGFGLAAGHLAGLPSALQNPYLKKDLLTLFQPPPDGLEQGFLHPVVRSSHPCLPNLLIWRKDIAGYAGRWTSRGSNISSRSREELNLGYKNTKSMAKLPDTLDPVQLNRIQAIHRGFLYQHLYAVGCILQSRGTDVEVIRIETDEDIEVFSPLAVDYIQVKTRGRDLLRSDISGALERFESLRKEHRSGRRNTDARFRVVTNAALSPSLANQYGSDVWPSDVFIHCPGTAILPQHLPEPWVSLEDALRFCATCAESIPFGTLKPENVVWKLTAVVHYRAAGGGGSSEIRAADLTPLFEQVVLALQPVPSLPAPYFAQESEPSFDDVDSPRLLVGQSGCGKTTWAAGYCQHSPKSVLYLTARGCEDDIESQILRELAARFLTPNEHGFVLGCGSALSGLRGVNALCKERSISIVVDDCHLLDSDVIRSVLEACPNLQWVLLSHRGNTVNQLGINMETFGGWSAETLARYGRHAGVSLNPVDAQKAITMTGGLPLFAIGTINFAKNSYAGDFSKACAELQSAEHLQRTFQEQVLRKVVDSLSATAKLALKIVSLLGGLVPKNELSALMGALGCSKSQLVSAIRDLVDFGIVSSVNQDEIRIHDSFGWFSSTLSCETEVLVVARDHLLTALSSHPSKRQVLALLTILEKVGGFKALLDSLDVEMLFDLGVGEELRRFAMAAFSVSELSESDRFWALDAAAYCDICELDCERLRELLNKMAIIVESGQLDEKAAASLASKRSILAARSGTIEKALEFHSRALSFLGDVDSQLVCKYNFAAELYRGGLYVLAYDEAQAVNQEYFALCHLRPEEIVGENLPEISSLIQERQVCAGRIKRLADSCHLVALCATKLNLGPERLFFFQAFKLYQLAGAPSSIVKSGQDVIDLLAEIPGEQKEAKGFSDQLVRIVETGELYSLRFPVLSQRAVILAHCGEFTSAETLLDELAAYGDVDETFQADYVNQRQIVLRLRAEAIRNAPAAKPGPPKRRKIGRNEKCPCGSGKKYKRCCLKNSS